jgi:hypothetical protein
LLLRVSLPLNRALFRTFYMTSLPLEVYNKTVATRSMVQTTDALYKSELTCGFSHLTFWPGMFFIRLVAYVPSHCSHPTHILLLDGSLNDQETLGAGIA